MVQETEWGSLVIAVLSHPAYAAVVVFIFGAIVGSFLNVCIVRLPKKESLVLPSSHCPDCKTPIPYYHNIPLVSYLILRAHCRSCGVLISPRYFIVELLMAVLAVGLFQRFGLGLVFFVDFLFVGSLIVISFIDLDVRIVPDVISLPGIVLGLLFSVVNRLMLADHLSVLPSPISSLLGIVIGGGSLLLVAWMYQLLAGREGMGGGDIKLLAMIGAFLGWPSVPVTLFSASLTGSLVGILLMVRKGVDGQYALPFAPFLCLGALFAIFLGDWLVSFYIPVG